ncbi:hypothetical protein [Aquamicrobium sp. LC103]|uniref:hypothetical protein n=1 Tax=Aquamicrobium sp. LC103 TaxID=1120658 RepID=UPI00063ECDF4|nr:hypothetical protein [Aquamicrobium sp. LC103]TKT69546.1 hypothetical protein XW59_027440 [Aquamicrobium sp. LC103]
MLVEEGDPHEIGSRLLKVWEVEDNPVFWSETTPGSEAYSKFRGEVADLDIETDPVHLLEGSSIENSRIVHRNADDWIGPAGCLEMLMYGHQHARMNTFTDPTEFGSFILRSPDEERLRVYFYTNNQDGLGNMDVIVTPVLEDKREGWDVLVALHSHVFHPGQPEINGILAPSEPDADFHANLHASLGLREGWITNGVHTVRMPSSSFDDFTRPSGRGEVSNPYE